MSDYVGLPPHPDRSLGWRVYSGSQFVEFVPNEAELAPLAERFADYAESLVIAAAACGAALFPLPAPLPPLGVPVHPLMLPLFAPAQGPSPALCMREPHSESPWHWDGTGTWWR